MPINVTEAQRGLIEWVHREHNTVDYRRGNGTRSLGSSLARLDLIELHRRLCYGEIAVKEEAA